MSDIRFSPAPRSVSTAGTIGAVLAVVLLALLAAVVAVLGLLFTLAADGCGTEGTEEVFLCGSAGLTLAVGTPIAGAVLGVVVALCGFLPIPFKGRRPILISLGYLIVLGGLGIGALIAFHS